MARSPERCRRLDASLKAGLTRELLPIVEILLSPSLSVGSMTTISANRTGLSAGTLLNLVFLVLAAALAAALFVQIGSAWSELGLANRAGRLADTDRQLFEVTQATRLSRGDSQAMLQTSTTPSQSSTKTRAATEKQIKAVLAGIDPSLAPGVAQRSADILKHWAEVEPFYKGIVALAAKPRTERDIKETEGWYKSMGVVVEDLSGLSRAIAAETQAGRSGDRRAGAGAAIFLVDPREPGRRMLDGALADRHQHAARRRDQDQIAGPRAARDAPALDARRSARPSRGVGAVLAAAAVARDTIVKAFAWRDAAYASLGGATPVSATVWGNTCNAPFGPCWASPTRRSPA